MAKLCTARVSPAIVAALREDTAEYWQVWIQTHNDGGDPIDQGESFIVGTGATAQEAITDAVNQLRLAADALGRGVLALAESPDE